MFEGREPSTRSRGKIRLRSSVRCAAVRCSSGHNFHGVSGVQEVAEWLESHGWEYTATGWLCATHTEERSS